jgi:hypothetical protein
VRVTPFSCYLIYPKHKKVNAAYMNSCCDKRVGMMPKSTAFNDEDWFEYRCCLPATEIDSSLHSILAVCTTECSYCGKPFQAFISGKIIPHRHLTSVKAERDTDQSLYSSLLPLWLRSSDKYHA